jgi:hypothetical protein
MIKINFYKIIYYMDNLSQSIKEWVNHDNQLKKYSEKIKEIRSERNLIGEQIFHFVETNQLQNAVVEITDGKLKFQNVKQTSPLNFKFLEECLNDCISNTQSVKDIIKYIKQKREVVFKNDIKRTYN